MRIEFTQLAADDLFRLVDFRATYDLESADELEEALREAAPKLDPFWRRGRELAEFAPREVRELLIEGYVMRYELTDNERLVVLRYFHGREDR